MARKDCLRLEHDIYTVVEEFFSGSVSGRVFTSDTRPIDSSVEDVVVCKVTADASQFQGGKARVLVFVPDIDNGGGRLVPDKGRMAELAGMGDGLVLLLNERLADYWFDLDGATVVGSYPDSREHFVDIQLKFTTETF